MWCLRGGCSALSASHPHTTSHVPAGWLWLQGNRETARRVLQDQGVSVLTEAQVTELRRAGSVSSSGISSSSSEEGGGAGVSEGDDLAKRLVYLRDKEGQQEVRATGWGWKLECGLASLGCWRSC